MSLIKKMVIKRKDGSVYRLRGPNPIMVSQSSWGEGDMAIAHNLNPPEVVTRRGDEEGPPEVSLRDIQPEEIEVPAIELDPSELPPRAEKKKRIVPKDVPKEMVYVLPATITENYDALYDETRKQLTFGGKFTMEVVVADHTDLQLTLWTNSARVGVGSVIYVPNGKRWWRVSESFDKGGGHVMICHPSTLQPSFE